MNREQKISFGEAVDAMASREVERREKARFRNILALANSLEAAAVAASRGCTIAEGRELLKKADASTIPAYIQAAEVIYTATYGSRAVQPDTAEFVISIKRPKGTAGRIQNTTGENA